MPCFYSSLLYFYRDHFLKTAFQCNGKLCRSGLFACLKDALVCYGKDLGIAGLVGFDAVTVCQTGYFKGTGLLTFLQPYFPCIYRNGRCQLFASILRFCLFAHAAAAGLNFRFKHRCCALGGPWAPGMSFCCYLCTECEFYATTQAIGIACISFVCAGSILLISNFCAAGMISIVKFSIAVFSVRS